MQNAERELAAGELPVGIAAPPQHQRQTWWERAAFRLAVASCMVLTLFTVAEIVARPVGVQVYVGSEYNGILMGWLIFLAWPAVTRSRQHLIVDFFVGMMSRRVKLGIEWLTSLLMLIYLAALIYFSTKLALANWHNGVRTQGILRTPIAYPQIAMLVGLLLTWITQVALFLRDSRNFFTRGPLPEPESTGVGSAL